MSMSTLKAGGILANEIIEKSIVGTQLEPETAVELVKALALLSIAESMTNMEPDNVPSTDNNDA